MEDKYVWDLNPASDPARSGSITMTRANAWNFRPRLVFYLDGIGNEPTEISREHIVALEKAAGVGELSQIERNRIVEVRHMLLQVAKFYGGIDLSADDNGI